MTVYSLSFVACDYRLDVQCVQDSNCDLSSGGACTTAATGNHWCAYPDMNCSSGYRFSNEDVGDGVSGSCFVPVDAGVGSDAGSSMPRSCMGLPSTCGVDQNDSCCASPNIPGGTYYRSYDLAGDLGSGDANSPAMVSGFRLDKYEVTVQRFRAFVANGMGTQASPPEMSSGAHTNIPASGWEAGFNASLALDTTTLVAALKCDATLQTWTDPPAANEDRPINCVTWYEAMAFCIWDGGYLPTEAEWNYAATGGDQQRAYPWSTPASSLAIDISQASYYDGSNCAGGTSGCTLANLVFVGSRPGGDARWGQSEMAGNVLEWTLDWDGNYTNPCGDCAELAATSDRVARGGSFVGSVAMLRTGVRLGVAALRRAVSVGFRCARPL
ncbi:MAG TPA: SUMF1/EgtB/PvdO family nonheme iron enzyme [Kofleriaceae bacterium]|nr:SUMF1/EgtB/PvdO family nonheme iron enzyme [Kofleriaceae bacterium]